MCKHDLSLAVRMVEGEVGHPLDSCVNTFDKNVVS